MAHNREKKALYEVINKATWLKPHNDKAVEPPQVEELLKSEHPIAKLAAPGRIRWLNRPRIVQLNSGRVELSMPYQLAVALVLGLVLLVLMAFRIGQISYRGSQKATVGKTPASIQKPAPVVRAERPATGKITGSVPEGATAASKERKSMAAGEKAEAAAVKPKGDNRIVIQSYQLKDDLEPVKQYFAQSGIETEIKKIGDWYYLVTRDKYENPGKPGTNGYIMKQKIIELGAKYKAPAGYEAFGNKPFSDAYGKKFDE
jgi:hypothetical protein